MHPTRTLALIAAATLAACASTPTGSDRTATVQRTAFGVPHISAPDVETLAYAVAFAHAEDNACQTAQQLLLYSTGGKTRLKAAETEERLVDALEFGLCLTKVT